MVQNGSAIVDNQHRTLTGISPFVQPNRDLLWKQEFNNNSWFVIGHFDVDGHKLNFLFHLLIMSVKRGMPVLNSVFSITDETTGWYYGDDQITPMSKVTVSKDTFSIQAPNGSMSGDLNEINLSATMPDGKVDVTLNPKAPVIYNGGTGYFPMVDMGVYQYSVPNVETTGSLTIEGKTYALQGISWFDRQWQHHHNRRGLGGRWAWMDLNLDTGDKASLWWVVDENAGAENSWATILNADGTQTVARTSSLKESAFDYWRSPKSKQNYPTRWIVNIPDLDARLEITMENREQEIVSKHPALHKYEAACSINGVYQGKPTTGYCYVELLGPWP
ncbi:MAG: hypothetical protein LUC48_09185 [Clostridiales bacterium]|nr:hypothetical protein [Clostridiales bacterium]